MPDKLLELDLESLRNGLLSSDRYYNKPLVIFNSASFCGYTKQLYDFQKLFESEKIIPIAVPTNEFGKQEPGDNYEIIQHYQKKYGITFPIVIKSDLSIKLFSKYSKPEWNFTKYLFDKNHNFIKKFDAKVKPEELLSYV